ncbi:hypothetical protein SAMN02745146_2939 [Hymenobacter daecheongensis DSM 21074]|uniref:Uncharacterized protein n=1 Tax=Hymenobacter daecheongensis DSM 21074 TaxID=1121955 RepID=A0A1M6IQU2_9BACT|nr:hypothetical protein [Hymenobacter daecheongensis]SHJ36851.1 hypothetical protein SAMN02745146_2939 [Hymenobacter daecheongensis DSM 21074]
MANSSEAATAPKFVADALTVCKVQVLHLSLDDTLPPLAGSSQYAFKSEADILFNALEADQLRVDVHTTIMVRAKTRPAGAGKMRVRAQLAVVFRYQGLDNLRQTGKLPLPLAWTAVSLAYSTMRGQLQARLAGTSFGEACLPVVSPQQLWQPPALAAE